MNRRIKLFAVPWAVLFLIVSAGLAYAQEKSEIVFGYSAPMTGGMADLGTKIKNGYTVWKEMVNDQGGIYVKEYGKKLPVRLKMYDDKSDPTTAAKLYEKLITVDKVDFVLSPYGSSIGFPVSGICQKYKMPIVYVWVSADAVFKQDYDYVFCLIEPASRHLWTSVRFLKNKEVVPEPPKKLMILSAKELYMVTTAKGGLELARELGFDTYYEEVEKGVTDFATIITKAKSDGVDGIITALYPQDFFLFFRQVMEFGFRPKYFNGTHGPDIIDFWDTFGKRTEGLICSGFYEASWPTFQNEEYVQRYQKQYGFTPEHYDATGAGGQIMQQAIEKAGTLDNEKVKQVLLNGEFKCLLYPRVKFVSEDGYTNINKFAFTGVKQWQEGKCLTVFPTELAQAKVIYPLQPQW